MTFLTDVLTTAIATVSLFVGIVVVGMLLEIGAVIVDHFIMEEDEDDRSE